jgi:hypothetical protein
MKYPVDTIVMINNREWRVAEFRMGRGREWVYTLANECTDGSYDTMRLNEIAIGKILDQEPQGETSFDVPEEVFA